MGSTGKRAGGDMGTTTPTQENTQVDKYDYSQGTIEEAVKVFTDSTGISVKSDVISKTNEDNLRNVLSVVHKATVEDGIAVANIELYHTKHSAFAASDGYNIMLNPKYYNLKPDQLEQVYAATVTAEYHPKGTTANDIISHELNHNMYRNIINKEFGFWAGAEWGAARYWSKKSAAKDIVKQAIQDAGIKGAMQNVAMTISEYAAKSPVETLAEAWADFKRNGTNANPVSQAIAKIMQDKLNK